MAAMTLKLSPKLESALRSGHPWIYRNHLPKHRLAHGDWVRVSAGKAERIGLYDAESAIGLRLFAGETVPDEAWVAARVGEALDLRRGLLDSAETNAYRLLYGEGDYLPGIVADRYERYAVLKVYNSSLEGLVPWVVKALSRRLKLRGVVRRRGPGELETLWGKPPPPELTVRENGLRFVANLYEGQKTGLFLDHRDNRARLEGYSEGKTVLNLFSYSGAFSLYAARGGSLGVSSVDIAQAANRDARRNFELNGFDPADHDFVTADVFEYLQGCVSAARRFDLVILDPPSLAQNKKSRSAALRAYRKLNALALRTVRPGGLLASASCTTQVAPQDFKALLGDAARQTGRRAQVIHEAGHAPDHPVPLDFPEGRYLKFVLTRVL